MSLNRESSLRWMICCGGWAAIYAPAIAQIEGGRALDANTQVGGGLENPEAFQFVPGPADLIITGNVTFGQSFRGFSPIRNPTAFRGGVPSSSLSNFRRDSFGLSNYSMNPMVSPYFAAESQTVNVHEALRDPWADVLGGSANTFTLRRTDLGAVTPVPLGLPGASSGLNSGLTGSINTAAPYTTTLPTLNFDAASGVWSREGGQANKLELGGRDAGGLAPTGRLRLDDLAERSLLSVSPTLPDANPFATESSDSALAGSGQETTPSLSTYPTSEMATPLDVGDAIAASQETAIGLPPGQRDAATNSLSISSLPAESGDPYTDFQSALKWISRYQQVADDELIDADTASTVRAAPGSYDRAVQILEQTPLSLAGSRPTLSADYARQAETLLKNGEFSRAAGMYRLAATLEPGNPLIDLGMGHAQLGSGDYRSAYLSLTRGIAKFPGFEYFRIDLSIFLTDPTLLDRRRSELEKSLSVAEDHELRFLLGYAEYFSGLPQFGVENLKRAAASAPQDSVVRCVPDALAKQPFWKQ